MQLRGELYEIARVWIDEGLTVWRASLWELNEMLTEDDRVKLEERAAILEFYGGLTRSEAEQAAMTSTSRLSGRT